MSSHYQLQTFEAYMDAMRAELRLINKTSLCTNFYKIYLSIFSNFFITRNRPTTWTTFSTLFTICSVLTPPAPSPPRMSSLAPKQSILGLHEPLLTAASGLLLLVDEEEAGGGRLCLLGPTGLESRESEISASFRPTLVQVREVDTAGVSGVSGFFGVLRVFSRKLLRRGDFFLSLFVALRASLTTSGSWLLRLLSLMALTSCL